MFDNLKLCKKNNDENHTVKVGNIVIGDNKVVLIAGPCAVESLEQLDQTISNINDYDIIRGGAYKNRTSPYDFSGLKNDGLDILKTISTKHNKPIVSEIVQEEDLDAFVADVDVIQVGARNMQNFPLLSKVAKTMKPILLKRGLGNTVEELLYASEYILKEGNDQVILCERGIRTFENSTRFTLDISAIPVIKEHSKLPIIVDPSHAAGDSKYVCSLALAAIAAGADGLMVEVHNNPSQAKSDKNQALTPKEYNDLVAKVKKVAEAVGRKI